MKLRRRRRRLAPDQQPERRTVSRGDLAELAGGVCAVVGAYQLAGGWAAWATAAVALVLYGATEDTPPPPTRGAR